MEVKLLVGTPTQHGNVWAVYSNAMCNLEVKCASHGVRLTKGTVMGSCYIEDCRNKIADKFMNSDCTHLMFIDSDIGFDADYVFHMLKFMETDSKYAIMGANYPKKEIKWGAVVDAVKKGVPAEGLPYLASECTVEFPKVIAPISQGQPMPVNKLATGFMMIRKSAFELFRKTYPERAFSNKSRFLYFNCGLLDGEWHGEDYFFCKLMKDAGEQIWMCPWMDISHHGSHTFGKPVNA